MKLSRNQTKAAAPTVRHLFIDARKLEVYLNTEHAFVGEKKHFFFQKY